MCRRGLLILAVVLSLGDRVDGQRPAGTTADDVPFASDVPDSVGLFVSVPRLAEVQRALDRTRARHLLPILTGRQVAPAQTADLVRALTSLLELDASVAPDALTRSQIGLAAPSWADLGEAVWLLRPESPEIIDRWYPQQRRSFSGTMGEAQVFRTPSGLTVCRRADTLAASRRWGPESLLNEMTQLMAGTGGQALNRANAFRSPLTHLPADGLALAYLGRPPSPSDQVVTSPLSVPMIQHAVAGLYASDGKLDIAIQASLAAPYPERTLSREAVARLLALPQTTLAAWGFSFDFAEAYQTAATKPQPEGWARYLTLLAAIAGAPDDTSRGWSDLGPHVIAVWGQDLRETRHTPQVALMLESHNEGGSRVFARRIVDALIRLMQALDPADVAELLTIRDSRHLGRSISYVPLREYAAQSQLRAAQLFADTELAWAVSNGWLIVALSRDHIEQIIDAELGMFPVLAAVPDVGALQGPGAVYSSVAVAQTGLAANVLSEWLAAFRAGSPSLLDPVWWGSRPPAAPAAPPRLGIGMKVAQEPGVVVVARVYPNTAADGRLLAGDRILGVDGVLLSLTTPNADLRDRWTISQAEPGPTVRVLRDGTLADVTLPKHERNATAILPRIKPTEAAQEVASLGRTIPVIILAVRRTDETHVSARLSLRFAPPDASGADTPP